MTLTNAQKVALGHLRSAYVGPDGGRDEITENLPNRQYAVGLMFPREEAKSVDDGASGAQPDEDQELKAGIATTGDVEEQGAGVPIAEDWRPSSVAISFVTDRPAVHCDFWGATYARVEDDGPPRWQRREFSFDNLEIGIDVGPHPGSANAVPIEVGARWRAYGERYLVTVHARVLATASGDDREDAIASLYQVGLSVKATEGGSFHEYDTSRSTDLDEESAELRLRYRNRKVYAVGHGMAADWEFEEQGCTRVWLDPVPAFVVPTVETTGLESGSPAAQALSLGHLACIDTDTENVLSSLDAFVDAFAEWVNTERGRVASFGDDSKAAERIVVRSETALIRMRESVDLLRRPAKTDLRIAFALGMEAMRRQMRQSALGRGENEPVPFWRPFQLGFLLVALPSAIDQKHIDRELVDLIWFPTGGGKTEAYLGLAAIEIFHRRLVYGLSGGGTAVIARYTLRLLTAQQFQRAASLICAMELIRRTDHRARGMLLFTIGLWVGNEVTPRDRRAAKVALERLYKAARPEEANQFQIESCPWCEAALLPPKRATDHSLYGARLVGNDIVIHCTRPGCEFENELPIVVIDESLYSAPPTFLLATVDKFARLQFLPEAGKLLGLNTAFRQPSMIIQDELHLLSGPLGTTVAVFDAAIQILLAAGGSIPKIIASTATIRASGEQVQGLYGREVALYPPSGLDDDRTFFSRPVKSGEGRLYIGLMPQSLSQVSAVIAAVAPLIEIPEVIASGTEIDTTRDAYWTAVLYHNSLRELGRTGTLVVDDVNGRLEPRAERRDLRLRTVRADKVLELTSRRGPEELPQDLRELKRSADSGEAIDVVLSSNMLSVGIDIPRLALMLMVGQPKTTSEYIQATSRVGRGQVKGIVATLFRANRARDRSHFETFRGYHEALYRSVEPTSVTPWSLASRDRSLAGALVVLIRHTIPTLAPNVAAGKLDLKDTSQMTTIKALIDRLLALVERSDLIETTDAGAQLWASLRDWNRRADDARAACENLNYERTKGEATALLKRFGETGEGWVVADSMRSVEPNVAVEVREPSEEGSRGKNPA